MNGPIRSLAVLGGDQRQSILAGCLSHAGYEVISCGSERLTGETQKNPEEAVGTSDAVLLPLPYSTDGNTVNAPHAEKPIPLSAVLRAAKPDALLLGGKFDEGFLRCAQGYGFTVSDYYASPTLTVENALSTAEGAIAIAMQTLPVTLFGTKTAVIGFGRIGKLLAARLHALGSDVTVTARKEEDLALARSGGMDSCPTASLLPALADARCVFNTVPAPVIGRETLAGTRPDCLWIDLASKPGGIDRIAAEELHRQVIHALSLPGRYAPESAGESLARAVLRILEGGGSE